MSARRAAVLVILLVALAGGGLRGRPAGAQPTGPLRGSACAMLSSGVVAPPDRTLGFTKGFLVRDPDGHALEVVQP